MKHLVDFVCDGLDKQFAENKNEIKHYVDGILVSKDNKILILRRANYMRQFGGKWGFVGGSIDKKDKTNQEAVIREIKEETQIGLSSSEISNMKCVDKQGHEREDGSIGSDTEYWLVKLESEYNIKISREHAKYEWVDENNFKDKQGKYMPDIYHYIDLYYKGQL